MLLKIGNQKMGPKVGCFSLPPVKTCTPTPWCLQGRHGKVACYGLRGRMIWPNVTSSFKQMYAASKRRDFPDKMSAEIQKASVPYVRIHVTGDFYSVPYIRKWIEIANRRLRELRSGKVKPIAGEKVFQKIKDRFSK